MKDLKSRLEALIKLSDDATPGPWFHPKELPHLIQVTPDWDPDSFVVINDDEAASNNMDFIVASRTALPQLARALHVAVDTLSKFSDGYDVTDSATDVDWAEGALATITALLCEGERKQ